MGFCCHWAFVGRRPCVLRGGKGARYKKQLHAKRNKTIHRVDNCVSSHHNLYNIYIPFRRTLVLNVLGFIGCAKIGLCDLLFVQKKQSRKGKRSTGFFAYAFFALQIFVHTALLAYFLNSTIKRNYIKANLRSLWRCLILELASFAGITVFTILFVLAGWISLCVTERRK